MTAAGRGRGEEAELDGYGELISRLRAGLSELTTEELVRIRALLEAELDGDRLDRGSLEALLRALADGA